MRDPLHRAIDHHWRQHRPKMWKALQQSGQLLQALEVAASRTAQAEASLIQQGVPPHQAQERFREEWAFLPSEADVPELPNGDPSTWLGTSSSSQGSNSPSAETKPELPVISPQ